MRCAPGHQPNGDFIEFKAFMEKQIVESIEFDCSPLYTGAAQLAHPGWLASRCSRKR